MATARLVRNRPATTFSPFSRPPRILAPATAPERLRSIESQLCSAVSTPPRPRSGLHPPSFCERCHMVCLVRGCASGNLHLVLQIDFDVVRRWRYPMNVARSSGVTLEARATGRGRRMGEAADRPARDRLDCWRRSAPGDPWSGGRSRRLSYWDEKRPRVVPLELRASLIERATPALAPTPGISLSSRCSHFSERPLRCELEVFARGVRPDWTRGVTAAARHIAAFIVAPIEREAVFDWATNCPTCCAARCAGGGDQSLPLSEAPPCSAPDHCRVSACWSGVRGFPSCWPLL